MSEELLDCLGRWRSPAATSAFHVGRPPRNRGMRYPADPPPVEEIVAVMRTAGPGAYGDRLRAILVVLWRAGLRVGEALALAETDLDSARGAVLVRAGKGGKRREVGLDAWGWRTLDPWLEDRRQLPVGPLFCILHGPSRGRPWSAAAVRRELRRAGARAGVRRRLAPHQYADLRLMPTRRGEMLQVARSTAEKLGTIHRHSHPRSLNVATEQPGSEPREFRSA